MSEQTQVVDLDMGALAKHLAKSLDYEAVARAMRDQQMPKEVEQEAKAEQSAMEQKLDDVLKALKGEPADKIGEQVIEPDEPETKSFADFLKAIKRRDHERLVKVYNSRKDLIEGSGVAGGYLVPTDQRTQLLTVDPLNNIVRSRATVYNTNRASMTIPVLDQSDAPGSVKETDYFGGVHAYWTEETGTKTETEPDFNQLELKVHKLAGYTQVSDELMDDSAVGLDQLLRNLFGGIIGWREDYGFLRGTGVGQPLGVLNCGCLITQDRDDDNEIHLVDLANMMEHFLPASLGGGGSVWVANITTLNQFVQLADAGNNVIWIPNAREGLPMQLFGMPIVFTDSRLPTLGNTGDVLLADFKYYLILDNGQTSIDVSEHYAFVNDLTTWRFVHRVDGQCQLRAPIYIDTTNQVSPFVALHTDTT